MSVKTADSNWEHLFPEFRAKLQRVLEETAEATRVPWFMAEGYRSPERQLWLYAQGRTRPGPVVTWMRVPRWHGTGLAADCYPKVANLNAAPMEWFRTFRRIYQKHGLDNPAWAKGDMGHVQLSDPLTREKSLAWVRAGFPGNLGSAAAPDVRVYVRGVEVTDADAYLKNNHVVFALRPVADALDWTIENVTGGKALLVDDERDMEVPVEIVNKRGFVEARALKPFVAKMEWVALTKKLFLVD